MKKEALYHVAIYLRLSRDDEDIDGNSKTESNSIAWGVLSLSRCRVCESLKGSSCNTRANLALEKILSYIT